MRGPLQTALRGFNLDATVVVPADDRARLGAPLPLCAASPDCAGADPVDGRKGGAARAVASIGRRVDAPAVSPAGVARAPGVVNASPTDEPNIILRSARGARRVAGAAAPSKDAASDRAGARAGRVWRSARRVADVGRGRSCLRSMIYTKAIARFHRLLDWFHRGSVDSILEASVTLDVALSDRFGLSRGESDVMLQRYSRLERDIADALMRPGTADATLTSLLFLLIVMRKPQRVIETGVWHGVSSYVLLSAMKDVGTGRLISIDLPPLNRGARVEVGNVVPQHLREQWSLRLGASDQLLATAISERSGVDRFIHDSDHSYRNMMMEFRWHGMGSLPGVSWWLTTYTRMMPSSTSVTQ